MHKNLLAGLIGGGASLALVGAPTFTDNGDGRSGFWTADTTLPCYFEVDYGAVVGVYTESAFSYTAAPLPNLKLSAHHVVPVPDAVYGAIGPLLDGFCQFRGKLPGALSVALGTGTFSIAPPPPLPVLTRVSDFDSTIISGQIWNNGVVVGPAYANRKIVCVYHHNVTGGPWTPTGVVAMGDVYGTLHLSKDDGSGSHMMIFSIELPAGTTVNNLIIEMTDAPFDVGHYVIYTMDSSLAAAVPTTGFSTPGAAASNTAPFVGTAGGCAVTGCGWSNTASKSPAMASPFAPATYVTNGFISSIKNGLASSGSQNAVCNWTGSYTSVQDVVAWAPV